MFNKVENLYCHNNGRNCVDPVVLFKLVFIQAILKKFNKIITKCQKC